MKRATRFRVAEAHVQPATPVPLRSSSEPVPETAGESAACSRFGRWQFAARAIRVFVAIGCLIVFVGDARALDPPEKPVITVEAESTPVIEGEEARFLVSRAGPVEEGLEVLAEVSATGSLAFSGGPRTVTLRIEPESRLHSFGLLTTADDRDEADRNVTLTVMAPEDGSYEVGAQSSATVVIEDDDDLEVQVTTAVVDANGLALTEVPEDVGAATIRLTATTNGSLAPTGAFGVAVSTRADSAVSPDDYAALSVHVGYAAADWVFVAAEGNYKAVKDVSLTIVDDSLQEPELETLGLITERAPDTPTYVSFPPSLELAIVDNDSVPVDPPSDPPPSDPPEPEPPEVTVAAGTASVTEGTEVTLTLSRTGDSSASLTVSVEVSETGSMIRGAAPTSAVFDAGEARTTFSDRDLTPGTTRYYRVCALNSAGVGPPSNVSSAVTNLAPPEVTVQAVESRVVEGAEAAFTLKRTGAAAEPLTVGLEVTATGSMIGAEPPTSALFPAGAGETTLTVRTIDDRVDEPDREIVAKLLNGAGYTLGSATSATVQVKDNDAAPVLSIAGASAPEGGGDLTFQVALQGQSSMPVEVEWSTSPGTATVDQDYAAVSGVLTLDPGSAGGAIVISLRDDTLFEENETFTVSLSRPRNAKLRVGAASATGVIEDDDDTAPAEEWLARFGRTAASNAVDAVEDRLTGRLGTGAQVVVAGHRVDVSGSDREHGATGSGQGNGAGGSAPAPVAGLGGIGQAAGGAVGLAGSGGGLLDAQPGRYGSGRMDAGDVLARSSFQFSSDSHAGVHRWSVWGSGAATRFDGGEDTLSLGGEVVTGTVGADVERGRVLFGVAVSHSRGDGDYRRAGVGGLRAREGDLSSDLTTGLPYLRVAVSDRLSVGGALGRGAGSMTLSEGDLGSIEADIGMSLGAFGARQELRSSAATDGFSLALRTDLLLVHATSDETAALPALSTDVNRLRLMIEGARRWQFESGTVLTPTVELGLRYDDGDAEPGGGLELGAGLRVENAARGLSAELTGRSLLAHEASELSEWGVGGSVRFEPGGGDRGLSIGLRSTLGAASSGIIRLWEQQNAAPLGYRATAPGSTTETEVGYGLAVLGSRGSLTPYLGAGLSQRYGETYKAGARLRFGEFFALDAEAARLEENAAAPSRYRAALLANLRW